MQRAQKQSEVVEVECIWIREHSLEKRKAKTMVRIRAEVRV